MAAGLLAGCLPFGHRTSPRRSARDPLGILALFLKATLGAAPPQ